MSNEFIPGPYDAFEKVAPGEPRFVLLGRDPAMPGAITEWARIRRMQAIRKHGNQRAGSKASIALKAELAQCNEAEEIALSAEEWRGGHTKVEAVRPTYNEIRRTEAEQAAVGRHNLLELAHKNMREAAYFWHEARDVLKRMGEIDEPAECAMSAMLDEINQMADSLRAKLKNSEGASS